MCGISDYDAICCMCMSVLRYQLLQGSTYACEIETMSLQMRIQHRFNTMPCECKVMKAASVCSSIHFHCLCRSCQRSNPTVGPYRLTQMLLVWRFGSKQSTAHTCTERCTMLPYHWKYWMAGCSSLLYFDHVHIILLWPLGSRPVFEWEAMWKAVLREKPKPLVLHKSTITFPRESLA